MSLEKFAFDNLKKRHPNVRKNGLRACLREIGAYEMLMGGSFGFVPDATEVVGDTLFIYEIEDTNKLSETKLDIIQMFSHDLYDTRGYYTVLVALNRYGTEETRVWTVKDEIKWTHGPTGNWLSESEIEKYEEM
ncbi:MAG: hypothetical protein ABSG80_13120 [Verrucomicrobiota bacterium]|jgi:hypothetical protein